MLFEKKGTKTDGKQISDYISDYVSNPKNDDYEAITDA